MEEESQKRRTDTEHCPCLHTWGIGRRPFHKRSNNTLEFKTWEAGSKVEVFSSSAYSLFGDVSEDAGQELVPLLDFSLQTSIVHTLP